MNTGIFTGITLIAFLATDVSAQDAVSEPEMEQARNTDSTLEQEENAEVDSSPTGLNLICVGAGAANKPTVANAYGTSSYSGANSNVSGTNSATIVGTRSQGFEDQVSIRMNESEGRLRMPRVMLPAIRGGEDGWFKMKNIEYKDSEITASIAVNVLNNPKLRIDRYTGAISISGKAGDYSGQCQKFDPAETQRQF